MLHTYLHNYKNFLFQKFQDSTRSLNTFAHEVGHNMGAQHDEKVGCGSNYIMSEYGSKQNVFSSCSIRDIHSEIDTVEYEDKKKVDKCLENLPMKSNDENFSICEQTSNGKYVCLDFWRYVIY